MSPERFVKGESERTVFLFNQLTASFFPLGLARTYTIQGDTAKAAYQDFLTLWKGADPDIPILKNANVEYASLR
jgi:eukaryotic-like serine/threonine-protein kinase